MEHANEIHDGWLPEQWYPLIESRRLRRKPLGIQRLGQRIVLWRDASGVAIALRDRCPHRGVALSLGAVRGDRIECPYHVEVTGSHIETWGELRKPGAIKGLAFRMDFKMPCVTLIQLTQKVVFVVADCPIDEHSTWRWARYYVDYVPVRKLWAELDERRKASPDAGDSSLKQVF